jgi:ribonuclease
LADRHRRSRDLPDARPMQPFARCVPRHRPRFPLLAPLVVLGVLASLLATPAASLRPVAFAPASKPFCLVDTHIPDEAYAVEEFVRTHNYAPPPGLKGGRPYTDDTHALPPLWRPYKEYDVFPPVVDRGRRPERVVLSDSLAALTWYTPDHYRHFLLMYPPWCIA